MKKTTSKKLIVQAKNSFNMLFKTVEYQKIISDDEQRERLIELLRVQSKGAYLDLATGTGYVGFSIKKRYPDCSVIGLDIANETLFENLKKAKELALSNIDFFIFDGITFPDFNTKFDGIICRYGLHHFPEIDVTLKQINKIMKNDGILVISDAIRNDHDHEDFINKFQRLKKDGHVKMYTRDEMLSLFQKHNFTEAESFYSKITFSHELNPEYRSLLKTTSLKTKEKYSVVIGDNKVTLTFNILNIAFIRNPKQLRRTAFCRR